MSFQPGAFLSTNFGGRAENVEVPHLDTRAPGTTDVQYPLGKHWINTASQNTYTLTNLTTSNGTTTANWVIEGAGAGTVASLTTDDSTVVTPTSGNINLAGTGSLATTGSGSTATVGLTGLTNHNVLVGAGTATITKVAPSATSGVALISQGASSDPAYGTVVVAGGGTGATTLTAHGVLIGEGTGTVVATTAGTNGQLLIGSTAADPVFGTLTSTTGVTFTGGAGSLAVNIANGGFAVTTVAGASQALAVQTMFIANDSAQTTFTLPAVAAVGSQIQIIGSGLNIGGWIVAQGASQEIWGPAGHSSNGATGTATSGGAAGQCVLLTCVVANNVFVITSNSGTITLA